MLRDSSGRGWRFLVSPRWLGYYAMLVVFAVACVLLSRWQFARMDEAEAEIHLIKVNYDAPAQPLETLVSSPDKFDEKRLKWKTAKLTGKYLDQTVLARSRPGPNGAGSDILSPVKTSEDLIFWVDRGWVEADTPVQKVPSPPRGDVTVTVRLRAAEPLVAGRESTATTVGSINIGELMKVAKLPANTRAYSASYGMLVAESPAAGHGTLPEKPTRDSGLHLSYAIQWVIFILIALIGVGYAARKEYKLLNRGSRKVQEAEERAAARRARRKPSDAEEEDALLDG